MDTFLKNCAEVEETVARIYRVLHKSVAAEPELRDIWLAMAEDEDAHAREIRLALRLLPEAVIEGRRIPAAEVGQLLARAGELLARVSREPLSAEDALRLSRHLEEDFLRVHVLCAARFVDDGLRNVFEHLGRADQEHVACIAACCRRYGIPDEAGQDHN